jgi:hypothetical protein
LRDAESKYHNHFFQSPPAFPEIRRVNPESDCFAVLNRPTVGLLDGVPIYEKIKDRD